MSVEEKSEKVGGNCLHINGNLLYTASDNWGKNIGKTYQEILIELVQRKKPVMEGYDINIKAEEGNRCMSGTTWSNLEMAHRRQIVIQEHHQAPGRRP